MAGHRPGLSIELIQQKTAMIKQSRIIHPGSIINVNAGNITHYLHPHHQAETYDIYLPMPDLSLGIITIINPLKLTIELRSWDWYKSSPPTPIIHDKRYIPPFSVIESTITIENEEIITIKVCADPQSPTTLVWCINEDV